MVVVLPDAISPAFVNSLFAWTISNDVLQGYLTYVVMFGLCKSLIASFIRGLFI